MQRALYLGITIAAMLAATGCKNVSERVQDVTAATEQTDEKLTVGTVQREIRVGMSGAEVIETLGAPNMVTTDAKRRENWVYDKISTQTVQASSSGGVNALMLIGAVIGPAVGASVGGSESSSAASKTTTQRTLTIVIKFDEEGLVRDFAYRYSSF